MADFLSNCNSSKDGSGMATCIALSTTIGVSVILLIGALVILCCVCYRRKRQRRVRRREHVSQRKDIHSSQAMILGGYEEVVNAICRQSSSHERESRECADQEYASVADEQPQETVTEAEGVKPSSVRKSRGGMQKKPTVLPPPRHQSLFKDNLAAVCSGGNVPSHHNSTEHLYDSVDESLGSGDPLYHILESPNVGNQQGNNPHLYHVLDGPTKPEVGGEKGVPKVATPHLPLPPKPLLGLANRHRVQSCATVNSVPPNNVQSTSGSVSSGKKSIRNQVRSVMAIYEEVPAEDKSRSSSAVRLPPTLAKPEVKGGTAEKKKEPVYHVLEECSSVEEASRVSSKEQQRKEQTVKANSGSVFKNDHIENVAELTVCKTEGVCFESQLPKMTKPTLSEKAEEHKYAEPVALKKTSAAHHACELFDDPAYCTQPHKAVNTQRSVTTGNGTDKSISDELSYATPSVSIKQMDSPSQPTDGLFDDPKYNCAVIGGTGASQGGKVLFDDPKYQPGQFQARHRRVSDKKRRVVRHSSSVDHFNALIYSNTAEFLDASERKSRGSSLHDLTEKRCSELYIKVTHL